MVIVDDCKFRPCLNSKTTVLTVDAIIKVMKKTCSRLNNLTNFKEREEKKKGNNKKKTTT